MSSYKTNCFIFIIFQINSIYVHMVSGSCLKAPYKTCKQILKEADGDSLVQCSRSALINRNYVLIVDTVNRLITFKDNLGRVDIGITYRKKIAKEFGNS